MRQEVNLYPPELRNEGDWPTARMLILVVSLMAPIMVAVLALHVWHLVVAQTEIVAKQRERTEIQQRIDMLTGKIMPAESDEVFQSKVQAIEERIAKHDRLRKALKGDVTTGSGGYSEQFIGLARQAVPGVWLTYLSVRGSGRDMNLRGRAYDAAQIPHYLERLAQEPVFSSIQINTLKVEKPKVAPTPEWSAAPAACCEFLVEAGGS